MSTSRFVIGIVREDGEAVLLRPGARGERDLVAEITTKAVAKGIGMFRSEAKVKIAIHDSVREVLRELKSEVVPT